MNQIARDDRKARRARVIEICEEQKGRAEEQLRRIRREMRTTTNTDALIKSLMSLSRGGNGERTQRNIAGAYQGDDKSKPIIRGPEIKEEVHKIATKINEAEAIDVATVREVLHWLGIREARTAGRDRTEEIDRICTSEKGRMALRKFQQHKGLGSDGFDGFLIRNAPCINCKTLTTKCRRPDAPRDAQARRTNASEKRRRGGGHTRSGRTDPGAWLDRARGSSPAGAEARADVPDVTAGRE
eukprot:6195330-Pleurochrysis_carterae.AAC.1